MVLLGCTGKDKDSSQAMLPPARHEGLVTSDGINICCT